jgi:hypothetical protein
MENTVQCSNLAEILALGTWTYGLWTPKRYGLLGMGEVWVMVVKSLRTNPGVRKIYGLLGSMAYRTYGLAESRLYQHKYVRGRGTVRLMFSVVLDPDPCRVRSKRPAT